MYPPRTNSAMRCKKHRETYCGLNTKSSAFRNERRVDVFFSLKAVCLEGKLAVSEYQRKCLAALVSSVL